jgi:hypothetical protein
MDSRSRLVLSSLVLCAVASTASAFNPQPEPPGFGMLGIISSQTARLNISFQPPPEPERGAVPPGPCAGTIQLRFLDATGNVLAEKSVRLIAGMSDALELEGVARGSEVGGLRHQIRASVSWVDFPPGPCRGGGLLGTVEVYNIATGETTFVLPGTLGAFQEVNNQH